MGCKCFVLLKINIVGILHSVSKKTSIYVIVYLFIFFFSCMNASCPHSEIKPVGNKLP